MSYILDALRRAQSERERGEVPGLDAQMAAPGLPAPPPRQAMWLWLCLALALVVVLALVTTLLSAGAGRTAPSGGVAAAPEPALPATGSSLTQMQPQIPPQPQPVQQAIRAADVLPTRPLVVSAPRPPLVAGVAPAGGAAALPVAPALGPGLEGRSGAQTPVLRTQKLEQLSPEQRRELPPMVLGGSVWSEQAGSRFVIVNGQVVHEGEPAAAGVTVQRIDARSVLLRWRDLLVELPL